MPRKLSKQIEIVTSGKNASVWTDTENPLLFEKIKKDISVDVVVVGGGITGVTTAYNLVNEGKKVALIEDGAIGSGETGRTTAHFTYALDDRYYSIKKLLGQEMAKLAAQSHKEAIDFVEKIIKKEKIKCDFKRVDGYLFLHYTDSTETLKKELDELHSIGFKNVKIVKSSPQKSLNSGPCLIFPDQATLHPLKYINALCRIIKKKGGLIFTETHVRKTKERKVITDTRIEISAKDIVIATGSNIKGGKIFTKQVPYRSYVIAFRVPKGSVTDALYWDTGNQDKGQPYPYHYIRIYSLDKKTDLLIVGGEDHKTGQQDEPEEKIFSNIERWTKERFPMIGKDEYRWSGQVVEPLDYMAFIGESPYHKGQRIWIATGDSGNGMTHGTIAGVLLTDLIMGRKNKWTEVYDPQRKTGYITKEFLKEGINFAKQYLDYLMPGEIKSPKELGKDQGGVMRQGVTKLAIYRDKKGKVHSHSAVCTHQGCLVKWNNIEKTFDCPCHGSRFSSIGKVLNGPATKPLEPKKLKEE